MADLPAIPAVGVVERRLVALVADVLGDEAAAGIVSPLFHLGRDLALSVAQRDRLIQRIEAEFGVAAVGSLYHQLAGLRGDPSITHIALLVHIELEESAHGS